MTRRWSSAGPTGRSRSPRSTRRRREPAGGSAAAGMSRKDLKELGEHLDAGQAGLVVVAVSDMGAKIEREMKRARKVEARELKADTASIEADAKAAGA